MGREKILFKSEEKKTKSEIADILNRIADKIEQGNISLDNGAGSIDLQFPENMVLEIKVEEEINHKTKHSFEIELEWTVGANEQGSMVIV